MRQSFEIVKSLPDKEELRAITKVNNKKAMLEGIIPPRDKNYFEMTQGKSVVVSCRNGTSINGHIRLSLPNVAIVGYIVEKEDGTPLTISDFYSKTDSNNNNVMVFMIDKPNHTYIFDSVVSQELSKIEEIKHISSRFGCTPLQFIKLIDELSEKYPQKFI